MKKEREILEYCCVIVTYNRNELLLRNLRHIFVQTIVPSKIFIVDNHGSYNCYEFLKINLSNEELSLIDYNYLDTNLGGAGGFSYGLRKAFEHGYDRYLVMDDDGYLYNENTVFLLLEGCSKLELSSEDAVLANSVVVSEDDTNVLSFGLGKAEKLTDIKGKSIIYNLVNPFNGTLISKKLISDIGYPFADFFIKGDEVDYMNRAIKNGAQVFTVVKSIYVHPRIKGRKSIYVFGRKFYKFIETPIKEYYSIRNFTYSSIKNFGTLKGFLKSLFNYFKRLFCVFTCKCEKFKTFKMINKGFFHGLKGKLGIYKQ